MLQSVAVNGMCCSALRCVAVCCSVFQSVAMCCRVLRCMVCVVVRCGVLQCEELHLRLVSIRKSQLATRLSALNECKVHF